MNKTVVPREVLIKNADAILHAHEDILKDKMDALFTKLNLLDCRNLKKIWPEIATSAEMPTNKVYLQSLQETFDQPMSRISVMVEKMQNNGLVIWERGESGTYIRLTSRAFELYHQQQDILLSYVERVMVKIGKERLQEILAALAELEGALASEMPTAE